MKNSVFLRAFSGFMTLVFSLSAVGADKPHTEPATVRAVNDFTAVYAKMQTSYKKSGPQAFVDELSFIEDKDAKNKILKTLAKLPPLPSMTSCGETCLQFENEGQKISLDLTNIGSGLVAINNEAFRFDVTRDNFGTRLEEIESLVQKSNQARTFPGASVLSDTFAQVCRILVPEAHAAMPTWAKVLIGVVIAVVALAAIWWIGKTLIDRSEKRTANRIRESEKRIRKAIKKSQEAVQETVNSHSSSTSTTTDTTSSEETTTETAVEDADDAVEASEASEESDSDGRGTVRN